FLLQRSQAKDTLAMQVKLNELLAAVNQASSQLINLEDRSEAEVQQIHDEFQQLRAGECAAHSIEEVRSERISPEEVRLTVTKDVPLSEDAGPDGDGSGRG